MVWLYAHSPFAGRCRRRLRPFMQDFYVFSPCIPVCWLVGWMDALCVRVRVTVTCVGFVLRYRMSQPALICMKGSMSSSSMIACGCDSALAMCLSVPTLSRLLHQCYWVVTGVRPTPCAPLHVHYVLLYPSHPSYLAIAHHCPPCYSLGLRRMIGIRVVRMYLLFRHPISQLADIGA